MPWKDPAQGKAYRAAYYLANKAKHQAYNKAKRAANPNANRDMQLRRNYGIDLEQYNAMFQEQRGLCSICHRPPVASKKLVVDHCHATGHVRALLCSQCNVAIGMMSDDPERLYAAAAYLERFNEY